MKKQFVLVCWMGILLANPWPGSGIPRADAQSSDPSRWMEPTHRFSGWQLGEAATYRAVLNGKIPDDLKFLRGSVYDDRNRMIAQVEVSREQFLEQGWIWTAPEPGLYEVAFESRGDSSSSWIPLVRKYSLRAPNKNQQEFEVARWTFAVHARPALPMNRRSRQFGVSIQSDAEIEMAEWVGLRFARIHSIGWGAQFSREAGGIELQPGVYNWSGLDRTMDQLRGYGFDIIGNIVYTPRWASPHPEKDNVNICVLEFSAYAPVNMDDWSNFVEQCVRRYGDDIRTWELWNEPNLPGSSVFWNDTPENFARLLKAGYAAVKRIQPDSDIWIGGLGPRTSYHAFYNQLLKLGGAEAFDTLALHGSKVTPQPFYDIDRFHSVTNKPWVNSEWHAILYQATSSESANLPSEQAVTRGMLLDLMGQIKEGVGPIAFFAMLGIVDREVMDFSRANRWFVHWSGLFRSRPANEPRLPAVVLRHFLGTLRSDRLMYRAGFKFGNRHEAAWFENGDQPLLVLWPGEGEAAFSDPRIGELITPETRITRWDGKPVALQDKTFLVDPDSFYFLENIETEAAARLQPSDEVLFNPRLARRELMESVRGRFYPRPIFSRDTFQPAEHLDWQDADFAYVSLDPQPRPEGFSAEFAVGWTASAVEIAVRVNDRIFSTV
ncbi:MAG: hypothetical protein U1E27_11585, partial [Kiritimatiellia bacterium]|nr:hypothetical protein [Kiritimatiellia bacterium]